MHVQVNTSRNSVEDSNWRANELKRNPAAEEAEIWVGPWKTPRSVYWENVHWDQQARETTDNRYRPTDDSELSNQNLKYN